MKKTRRHEKAAFVEDDTGNIASTEEVATLQILQNKRCLRDPGFSSRNRNGQKH